MTTEQVVRLVLLVVSWSALLLRTRAAFLARQRPVWLALLALAVEIALLQDEVAVTVVRVSGVPNLDVFLGGWCHIVMMSILWTIASVDSPNAWSRRGRRFRFWFTAAIVTVILIAELWSTLAAEATRDRALPVSAYRNVITVGWIAYLLFMAVASADSARRLWRHQRATSFGALRLAVMLLFIGACASVVYVFGRAVTVVNGSGQGSASDTLVLYASMTYFLCFVFGCAIVVVAPIVAGVRAWWQRCRLFHLWHSLTQAVPGVVLEDCPSLGRDLLQLRHSIVRLQRRVIEIRDAAITLREWVTPEQLAAVTAEVGESGLTGMEAAGTVTARCLVLGRAAKLAGAPRSTEVPAIATDGGDDLDSEVRWLMAVRAAYRERPHFSADQNSRTVDSDKLA
ncbi:MAB_1171c family putative transporter [Actinoplanes sp. TFC3]|uniref:MAB_1171c family putative transporter n=1 Tax=Actinoplanes sp. TFC3 TaxID=1710355 RepID=UPI0008307420|nr:MAB_1171c family putative transporter [Actinoplanes sp. TFC3]